MSINLNSGSMAYDETVAWIAKHDINVISSNNCNTVYEFSYIDNGKKVWCKAMVDNGETSLDTLHRIMERVCDVRRLIDGQEA